MKKVIIILFLCALPLPILYAQNGQPKESGKPPLKERISDFKRMLNLSEEQITKIESVFNKDQNKIEAFDKKQQEEMEKLKKEREAISEASNKEILALLNEEQQKEFKSFLEERKNRMRNMPPPMGQFAPQMMEQGRGDFMHEGMMPPPPQHDRIMDGRGMPRNNRNFIPSFEKRRPGRENRMGHFPKEELKESASSIDKKADN